MLAKWLIERFAPGWHDEAIETLNRRRHAYRVENGRHIPKLQLLEIWPLSAFIGSKDNLTVFDIGANRGLWCAAWMRTFSDLTTAYHAFEPLDGNRANFEMRLREGQVPGREKVRLHDACVGDGPGVVAIKYHAEVSPLASVVLDRVRQGNRVIDNAMSKNCVQYSLDQFCADRGIDTVHVAKVDVEGYEWQVLQGASGLLGSGRVRSVLFEFGEHQGILGQTFRSFWDLLTGHGYRIYRQRVGRNFFGLERIGVYDASLERFDSVWMILATLESEREFGPRVLIDYEPSVMPASSQALPPEIPG